MIKNKAKDVLGSIGMGLAIVGAVAGVVLLVVGIKVLYAWIATQFGIDTVWVL